MKRRQFLGLATAAAASVLLEARGSWPAEHVPCLLLDPGGSCCLPESHAGYEAAAGNFGLQSLAGRPSTWPAAVPATVIVPGCLEVRPELVGLMVACLERGSRVLLESAAGFGGPGVLQSHRLLLQRLGGVVQIGEPIDLWAGRHPGQETPYVHYRWPVPAVIRDFSRVIPLRVSGRPASETIGVADGKAVGARWRYRQGEVVFLSSALGPVLLSSDRQAHAWLRSLVECPKPS